ncbi:hypothetical protein [Cupriavidus gilardii]|uniref:hypothetical protein n=1 Tax=Cupriavidus gilardii TaxID=82541 RepID=UPI0006B2DE9C|nr:hypothetical protein [Cupriavidus gilardii]MCT9016934.1 hypothetical protein [Cupriavidus gilardii]MCT9056519.1 hypothetical protein [Cupriavidus gilardii]WNG69254.1 hypothetical protein QWJ31_19325 [Cupriavidus gilardii]
MQQLEVAPPVLVQDADLAVEDAARLQVADGGGDFRIPGGGVVPVAGLEARRLAFRSQPPTPATTAVKTAAIKSAFRLLTGIILFLLFI